MNCFIGAVQVFTPLLDRNATAFQKVGFGAGITFNGRQAYVGNVGGASKQIISWELSKNLW